jgi:hypothetical protein
MYQDKESQLASKSYGFLYAELALTLFSIALAFIAFTSCLIHYYTIHHSTTAMIMACQNFSETCFELRALNQIPVTAQGVKKKRTSSYIYETELPPSPLLNIKKPFKLLCLT